MVRFIFILFLFRRKNYTKKIAITSMQKKLVTDVLTSQFVRFTLTEFVRVHLGVVSSQRSSVKLYVCMYKKIVYSIGHSPLEVFRTNANKQ